MDIDETNRGIDFEERASTAAYRAELYRAASAAFEDAPSAEALAGLVEAAGTVADEDCSSKAEADLFSFLRGLAGRNMEELRTCIASEYAELFVGPRPPLAPYYESMYVGSPRRLMTAVTVDVRDVYAREGFSVVRKNRVPDDHIAYELEFMARLCEREAAELDADDGAAAESTARAERLFLKSHLGAWAGLLADAVEKAGCSAYYTAWARYTADLVETDLAELELRGR